MTASQLLKGDSVDGHAIAYSETGKSRAVIGPRLDEIKWVG